MSWQWYKQVVLPEATTTMVVQDFVDLWARHQKDFWDASTDFPDLTPRLPRMFLIAAAPKKFRAGLFGQQPWPRSSPRRWGVFFEAALTAEIWSDEQMVPLIKLDGPQPDEFVLRGAEAKRLARWWVVASLMEEQRSAGHSKAVATAVWSYMVDENGSIPVVGGMPWFGPWGRQIESQHLAKDRLQYLEPILLAVSAWNEGAAAFADRLLPPFFQLKLRPGRLPTIAQRPRRELAS
jgi:hypothetical protein